MGSEPSSDDDDGEDGERAKPAPTDAGLDARLDRAVSSSDAVAFLVAVAGDQAGRVYPLKHNTVFLGRLDGADVYIADPSVSSKHARIINGSNGFEIEDLASTNGTFVGGQRITRTRLRNGDRVTLGSVEFNFLLDRPIEATVALLPPGNWVPTSTPGALMRMPYQRNLPPPVVRAEPDDEAGPSLTELIQRLFFAYRFLRRHTRLIAILTVVGMALGFASIFILPPAAAAVCEVKLQPQLRSNPVDTERPSSEDSMHFFLGPERAFTNAELVRVTLRQLDGVEPTDSRVESVEGRLKFDNLEEPHLYRAMYKESLIAGRQLGPVQFLTAHLQNYVQAEITKALKVFTAEAEFLRNQMKSVEKDLATIGAERTQFRQANADRLPEEAVQTHSSRFALESRRADLLAQVRRLQGDLEAEKRQLKLENPLAQNKYQASQVYRTSLATVNQKLSEARARGLADGHPEIRQLNDEKQRIEGLINNEMQTEVSTVDRASIAGFQALQNKVETLQGQLGAARSDLADTDRNLGQVRHVVGDLPRVEERVQELSHKQDATNRLHTQLFEKLKKAELQVNLERVSAESRYELVKPPRLEKPGKLAWVLRCAIGLFAGFLLAGIAITVKEGRLIVSQTLASMDGRRHTSWR
jgi:pSer/pThr/pTyr-binding forkhead associated (FHA) protein